MFTVVSFMPRLQTPEHPATSGRAPELDEQTHGHEHLTLSQDSRGAKQRGHGSLFKASNEEMAHPTRARTARNGAWGQRAAVSGAGRSGHPPRFDRNVTFKNSVSRVV